jgi:hypothetical protein
MSIHARVMTQSRAHWVTALRVASPPRQELARGLAIFAKARGQPVAAPRTGPWQGGEAT